MDLTDGLTADAFLLFPFRWDGKGRLGVGGGVGGVIVYCKNLKGLHAG